MAVAACAGELPTPGPGMPTLAVAPAQSCALAGVTSVRMEAARGIWLVPVEINASRLRLILDTGAERTLLTEAVVTRLGLRRDAQHQTRTFGIGGLSTAADADVSSFAIGGAYLPVPSVTVGQFALPTQAGAPLDGLLGADILSAFDIDLDTRDGRLTLYRARDCPQAGAPWQEAFLSLGKVERMRDRLLVPIALDGVAGMATVDTGAQHSVVSERLATRAGVSQAEMVHDPSVTAHGAAAEQVSVPVHRFRRLQIGPGAIGDPLLPVVPMPEGLGDGLVGDDFLDGRRVWLSYASLRVFVTPLGTAPAVAMRP